MIVDSLEFSGGAEGRCSEMCGRSSENEVPGERPAIRGLRPNEKGNENTRPWNPKF